jgi:predicted RNA-binding protein (TIGR00451 family)
MRDLQRIRAIANYQFESDVGSSLFPDEVNVTYSPRTGRIRQVSLDGQLLATLRPRDGLFSLTIAGAERLKAVLRPMQSRVVARQEVADVIKSGRNLFARHVATVDEGVKPGSEVMITTRDDALLAVGKAMLSGEEMLVFKRGVAVKVRRGSEEAKA